jgi:hypothetical protein
MFAPSPRRGRMTLRRLGDGPPAAHRRQKAAADQALAAAAKTEIEKLEAEISAAENPGPAKVEALKAARELVQDAYGTR